MKKTEFTIKGMHCKSCVMLVTEALTDVKGVKNASVDLSKNKAVVEFDEKIVKERQLIEAIEKDGYKVLKQI
jgi:copper ion binding protein